MLSGVTIASKGEEQKDTLQTCLITHWPPPHIHPHLRGRANLGPERFLNSHGRKDSQAREQAAPVALGAHLQTHAWLQARTYLAGVLLHLNAHLANSGTRIHLAC